MNGRSLSCRADAPALVATRRMTQAFDESGSQTILLAVLTDDKGLGPADEGVLRTLVDELREDTENVVTLQEFVSAPTLRDDMTSKDHRAWYLPIGLAGELGSPQLHQVYGRVADIIKRTVAGSTLTASLAGPPATDADLTDMGARDLPLIVAATALMLFIIVLIIYRNPVTTLLPLITTGISLVTAQSIVAGFCQLGLAISNPGHCSDDRHYVRRRNRLCRLSHQPLSRLCAPRWGFGPSGQEGVDVRRQSDLGVRGHYGCHLSWDDLHPIRSVQNRRSGVGDCGLCDVTCRGDSAARHARARRASWLGRATPRHQRRFLAAFGNANCAPAQGLSARQFDCADHSGRRREPAT